jgi:hypothetical protein
MSAIDALEFGVEIWDARNNSVEELVALCNNAVVGKAACDAAIGLRPGTNLILSHRAQTIARERCRL